MEFTNPFPNLKSGEKPSKEDIVSALRLSLSAEEDATHLYTQIAAHTDDPKLKKLMLDVAKEEQVHIGEFQKLLDIMVDNETEAVEEGKKEAEDKMGTKETNEIADEIED